MNKTEVEISMKKVSVILPYYNGEDYISEAVKSLRSQTHRDIEVLLVNNGSVDNSEALARLAAGRDDRFFFLHQEQKGIDRALNTGLARTTGEFITFLDQDDVFLEQRIQAMVTRMENESANIAACRGYKIEKDGHVFGKTDPYIDSPALYPLMLMQRNIVSSLSYIMIRKETLLQYTPFPAECNRMLDYYLLINAAIHKEKTAFLNECLVKRRYHDRNVSLDRYEMERQAMPALKNYIDNNQQIREYYTADAIRTIMTGRYIDAVQYLRRNQRYIDILGYLEEFCNDGLIKKEFYNYFTVLAQLKTNLKDCRHTISSIPAEHPLIHFVKGLFHYETGDYKGAAEIFETAFHQSNGKMPEALNSLGLAQYHHNSREAENSLIRAINARPGYNDPFWNLHQILNETPGGLKHTEFLTPETIRYFQVTPFETD
jgi:glycosyltransferase involved in cell wall biosynthesis